MRVYVDFEEFFYRLLRNICVFFLLVRINKVTFSCKGSWKMRFLFWVVMYLVKNVIVVEEREFRYWDN